MTTEVHNMINGFFLLYVQALWMYRWDFHYMALIHAIPTSKVNYPENNMEKTSAVQPLYTKTE